MAWKPSQYDIYWLDGMIAALHEGGILMYPQARLIYRVSHKRKTLTLLNPQMLQEDAVSKEVHERTKIVLLHLEYKMHGTRGGG